ncbi:unnamed protein product [Rodentolepis nana]|uniref:Uncharacterized protein n=1 Tax=Rodentolepis nana TaxID=102285 RepID=A0A0R3TUL9_RODNA|nr:unnamed protein product [Rodentolepis nana]
MTLINVPLNCCKSACRHITANLLTIMVALILPMAFEFSPDLLIINVGDAITNERTELPKQFLTHLVFMLKNVATRLVILTPVKVNPDNLLDCLLDASPPGPFKANQLTIASSKPHRWALDEHFCQFYCFKRVLRQLKHFEGE